MFHMPIFFMATGYLYKENSIKDIKKLVLKKIKALWIPYISFTALFLLLNNFFIKVNIYTDNVLYLDSGLTEYVTLTEKLTIFDIVIQLLKGIVFKAKTELGGAFWFLEIMFWSSIIFVLVKWFISKYIKEQYREFFDYGIFIIVILINMTDIAFKGYERILAAYMLIFLGEKIKKYNRMERFKEKQSCIAFWFAFIILAILNNFQKLNISSITTSNPILLFIASFSGWVLLYGVAKFINRRNDRLAQCIAYISRHAIWIIALHFLAFKLINIAGVYMFDMPEYMSAAFPVLFGDGYWWGAYSVIGVALPLGVEYLFNQVRTKLRSNIDSYN